MIQQKSLLKIITLYLIAIVFVAFNIVSIKILSIATKVRFVLILASPMALPVNGWTRESSIAWVGNRW
jgi:uncharacterized membrane protein YqjE